MKKISVKNTYDIGISGQPSNQLRQLSQPKEIAVVPSTVPFIKPKLSVKVGDKVTIGSPVFYDKNNPELVFLSPAGGEVTDIQFGPRRRIDAVVIQVADDEDYEAFQKYELADVEKMTSKEVVYALMKGGMWGAMRSFPYKRVPKQDILPPAIFISLDHDEPYRPQSEVVLKDRLDDFNFGLSVLRKLSEKLYISCSSSNDWIKKSLSNVITHELEGAYPANNPGVFLYHAKEDASLNQSWTIEVQDVLAIASLFQTGKFPTERIVVSAGSSVSNPSHFISRIGAPVKSIAGSLKRGGAVRYIAGGVLTGRGTTDSDYLGAYEDAVHVLPEGENAEMFYFFKPGFKRPTKSNIYFSALVRGGKWIMDTYLNGGERSCIACGECMQVCPVGLAPQFIYKSLKAGEVEEPVEMGLLDCAECRLCTYVCPSKIELSQELIRAKHKFEKETA